jgi:hypothetical protein
MHGLCRSLRVSNGHSLMVSAGLCGSLTGLCRSLQVSAGLFWSLLVATGQYIQGRGHTTNTDIGIHLKLTRGLCYLFGSTGSPSWSH